MRHNYDTKRLLVFWVDLGVFKALALGFIPVCPLEETDPEGAASSFHKMEPSGSPSRLSLFCVIRIRGWSLAAPGERRRRERESQERENWEGDRIGGS